MPELEPEIVPEERIDLDPSCDCLPEPALALLKVLEETDIPLSAGEIADRLHALGHDSLTKRVAELLLYGALKGRVWQDNGYRWHLRGRKLHLKNAVIAQPDTPLSPEWARFRQYLDYYRDCLAEDDLPEISFPSRQPEKFSLQPELGCEWSGSGNGSMQFELSGNLQRFAIELRKKGRSAALSYGYPLYVRWVKTRDRGSFGICIPIFLQPLRHAEEGNLLDVEIVREWPRINNEFLEDMFESSEERLQFMHALGLLEPDGPPPEGGLSDIVRRMAALDLGLPCEVVEPLDPENLPAQPALPQIGRGGIYNRGLIVIGEKGKYTSGLSRELAELRGKNEESIAQSSLRFLFGKDTSQNTDTDRNETTPLYEVVRLNEEQREAVRSAMTRPITVVTGPPGTGKSQVVTAILASASLHGHRVLFASRNHKAVDVVEGRLRDICDYPLAVRVGASRERNTRQELMVFLTRMLALTTTSEDRRDEQESRGIYDRLLCRREKFLAALESIREARNELTRCENAKANDQKRLDEKVWDVLCRADDIPTEAGLHKAQGLLSYHLDKKLKLTARIKRWWRRRADFRLVCEHLASIVQHDKLLGKPPATPLKTRMLGTWMEYVSTAIDRIHILGRIRDYRIALENMRRAEGVEVIAERWAANDAQLAEYGAQLLRAHGRLLPERIQNPQYRNSFGRYRAILEHLANSHLDGPTYANLMREQETLFRDISAVLRAWCSTNLSVRGSLPFTPALFDLIVIDEASQCDIASAIPLLYRAKRAVIIGDSQQLRHISDIKKKRESQLLEKNGLRESADMLYTYAQNSLFDLAVTKPTASVICLREHFRSHADIIGFSNRHWYGNTLQVFTDYRSLRMPGDSSGGVSWVDVKGVSLTPRGGSVINCEEAAAVRDAVEDLLVNQQYAGTVGVVTPFRKQANLINNMVYDGRIDPQIIDRAELVIDTIYGFQGDQRDVVFLSLCVAPGLSSGGRRFLVENDNQFNVAITRARALLTVFGHRDECRRCGVNHVEKFTRYVDGLAGTSAPPLPGRIDPNDPRIGHHELPFYRAMVRAGLTPIPQYPVNQYRLDFAIIRDNVRLDIEIDGRTHHNEWNDLVRDMRLMALGWKIKRFWATCIEQEEDACVEQVIALLENPENGGG